MILRNKKLASAALSLAILGSSLTGASVVMAESVLVASAPQQAQYQEVRVTIDGKLQKFPQAAILYEGSTLVPMRGVFEALEAKIEWDNPTRTVTATKDSTTIVLTIGNNYAHVNGQKVALAKEALIVNGSTMVPLRFVAEALGAKVGWDAPSYTAIITNQGAGVANPTTPSKGTEVTNPSGAIKAAETNGRTYGSKTQAEYDTVVKKAKEALADVDSIEVPKAMADYLYNGARGTSTMDFYNMELRGYHNQYSPLLEAGISADTIVQDYKIGRVLNKLIYTNSRSTTVSTRGVDSAYHAIVEGKIDCDSLANTVALLFDLAGYDTAIIAQGTHAFALVKLDDQWTNGFRPVGTDAQAFKESLNNSFWHTEPRTGVINPDNPTPGKGTEATSPSGAIKAAETSGRVYGSKSQAEYDTVLKLAKEALADIDSIEVPKAMIDYFYNGVRFPSNERSKTVYEAEIKGYHTLYSPLLEAGISADTIVQDYKVGMVLNKLIRTSAKSTTVSTAGVDSAYHAIVEGKIDCDSLANTVALLYDLAGYDTAIIAQGTHAFALVKLEDQWVNGFRPVGTDAQAFKESLNNSFWHTRPN